MLSGHYAGLLHHSAKRFIALVLLPMHLGEAIRDSIAGNAAAHYLHNLLFLLGSDLSSASLMTSKFLIHAFYVWENRTAQKLIRTVQWIAGEGEKPVCTVSTTLPFQHVIDSLFTNEEFVPFHESEIIRDEERGRVYVSGLYERLTQLYESEDL